LRGVASRAVLLGHGDIQDDNIFKSFTNDAIQTDTKAIHFKLADLDLAKLVSEVSPQNTPAERMLPPEVLNTTEFSPTDRRIGIYRVGLLVLRFGLSRQLSFTCDETVVGRPSEMATQLPAQLNFAPEKALRRHVQYATSSAIELWRDIDSPASRIPTPSLQPCSPPAPARCTAFPNSRQGAPADRGGISRTA
jgi:hypothetical protein